MREGSDFVQRLRRSWETRPRVQQLDASGDETSLQMFLFPSSLSKGTGPEQWSSLIFSKKFNKVRTKMSFALWQAHNNPRRNVNQTIFLNNGIQVLVIIIIWSKNHPCMKCNVTGGNLGVSYSVKLGVTHQQGLCKSETVKNAWEVSLLENTTLLLQVPEIDHEIEETLARCQLCSPKYATNFHCPHCNNIYKPIFFKAACPSYIHL